MENSSFNNLTANRKVEGSLKSTFMAETNGGVGGNSYAGNNDHTSHVKENDQLMGAKYLKTNGSASNKQGV